MQKKLSADLDPALRPYAATWTPQEQLIMADQFALWSKQLLTAAEAMSVGSEVLTDPKSAVPLLPPVWN